MALSRPIARAPAKPSAKAAQAATEVKRTAALEKAAKAAPEGVAAKPAAKASPVAKPAIKKPESKPLESGEKPSTHKPAAAPLQVVQPPVPTPSAPPTASGSAAPVGEHRPPAMPDRVPLRPAAKAETFVEGDHVVYPTHGVGKVERIATEEIAGHKLELIHITFEENRMTLRVPVAKARSAGLRKLATRKLFDEALAVLKGRARIKRTMWSRRAQEYEAKINSGDPLAIAEVVRDLHRNAGQPDQSFSERQIYEAAMDSLAAELAALDKTDKMTASTKLTNFLKTV